MSTEFLYPPAPLEPITNVEKTLEKKIYDTNIFINSYNIAKHMIAYFKYENR